MNRAAFCVVAALAAAAPRLAAAHPGRAIVVDGRGQVYFVDTIRDRLWRLGPDGTRTLLAEGVHTDRLVFAPDGAVRPAEPYLQLVSQRADTQARGDVALQAALGNAECVFASFVDPAGNVYCRAAGRLIRIDSAGIVVTLAAEASIETLETGVVAADGAIYVSDRRKILKVEFGSVVLLAGSDSRGRADGAGAAAQFGTVLALAADGAGNLFAVDYGNARIRRITPSGAVTTVARTSWPWRPTGVAVAADGAVYVLERRFAYGALMGAMVTGWVADFLGTPRVRRIAPDGSVATAAMVGGWPLAGPAVMVLLAGLAAVVVWRGVRLLRRLRHRTRVKP